MILTAFLVLLIVYGGTAIPFGWLLGLAVVAGTRSFIIAMANCLN